METFEWLAVIQLVWGGLYLLFIAVTIRRRRLQRDVVPWLIFYLAASALWMTGQGLYDLGFLSMLPEAILVRFSAYSILLLALLFLQLSWSVLRFGRASWGWWVFGAILVVSLVILDTNTLSLPQVLWRGENGIVRRQDVVLALLVFEWALFVGVTLFLTLRAYRRTEQPLHKNRITYWLLPLGFGIFADVLSLAGGETLGGALHLLSVYFVLYIALSVDLPDVRQITRHTTTRLLVGALSLALYTVVIAIVQPFLEGAPGVTPWLVGGALALILVIVINPVLELFRRWVRRLVFRRRYDASQTLRQYSLSISNILDLERLTAVAVGLISEALEIKRGAMFIAYREEGGIFLRGVQGLEVDDLDPGMLTEGSSIDDFFQSERRPLTQYDIDMLPRFRDILEEERAWFAGLTMDVYVPIYAHGEWIGLFALGAKTSGDAYYESDLVLLSTLADQTAVALENARLVDDLKRAYAELDRANRQLQETDELKTAFIGVVTHELRTPLSNLDFSMQLIERYGLDRLTPEQREQLEQLNAGIKSAKTMIDNLVTFATFISKQGELHLRRLDFRDVVSEALASLESVAEVNGVALHAEMPERAPLIQGDRARLTDAVYHLIHNAVKFNEEGGEAWVRCTVGEDALYFEVEDTGVGVPEEKVPELWEAFSQMADPLRRGVEGLGLGLALVNYVVDAHGGRVYAKSEVGVGSTFGFALPLGGVDRVSMPSLAEMVLEERRVEATEAAQDTPPEVEEEVPVIAEDLGESGDVGDSLAIADMLEGLKDPDWDPDEM
jgi:signal transduction histidine kinase